MNPILTAQNITQRYNGTPVIDDVSVSAEPGTVVGLIGPNGAGKTTLIKVLAGILKPLAGTVAFNNKPLSAWSRDALARSIGYLSQSRIVHWPVTVDRLVSLGRLPHRSPWQPLTSADQDSINDALSAADVESLRDRTVTTLSGGELARVLLARVLAGQPSVLLADEPVAGLDPGHRLQVLERLRYFSDRGRLVVIVLHDLTLASRFCDRLILLDQGKVVADAEPAKVLQPDRLQAVYGVDAVTVTHNGQQAVLPWANTKT